MKANVVIGVLVIASLAIPLATADDDGVPYWGQQVQRQVRDLTVRVRTLERHKGEAGVRPRGGKLSKEERLAVGAVGAAVRNMLSNPRSESILFTNALTVGQLATIRLLGEGLDGTRFGFRWTQVGVGRESSFFNCLWELGSKFRGAHVSGALEDDLYLGKAKKLVENFTSTLESGSLEKANHHYRELSSYLTYITRNAPK